MNKTIYKEKAVNKMTGKIVRYAIWSDNPEQVFVYEKGSARYGRYYSLDFFNENFVPLKIKSEQEKWEKGYKKIVKLLTESGLWPNIKERSEKLLSYGYDVWKNIREMDNNFDLFSLVKEKYNKDYYKLTNEERERITKEVTKEYFGNLIEKYPEYFYENGNPHFDSFEYCVPRFKSMWFGIVNESQKIIIQKHLDEKTNYHYSTDKWDGTSYDTTFEYNAEKNMAWYSEEYRGCGNGHYYLALNNSCALFYEHD